MNRQCRLGAPPASLALTAAACCLILLLASVGARAESQAHIREQVDTVVAEINSGRDPAGYPPDRFSPYVFIMAANGRLLVHPQLAGEYLQEKAWPIYAAISRANSEGLWVSYLWKGTGKQTYVRRTTNNLIVGSGS